MSIGQLGLAAHEPEVGHSSLVMHGMRSGGGSPRVVYVLRTRPGGGAGDMRPEAEAPALRRGCELRGVQVRGVARREMPLRDTQ